MSTFKSIFTERLRRRRYTPSLNDIRVDVYRNDKKTTVLILAPTGATVRVTCRKDGCGCGYYYNGGKLRYDAIYTKNVLESRDGGDTVYRGIVYRYTNRYEEEVGVFYEYDSFAAANYYSRSSDYTLTILRCGVALEERCRHYSDFYGNRRYENELNIYTIDVLTLSTYTTRELIELSKCLKCFNAKLVKRISF